MKRFRFLTLLVALAVLLSSFSVLPAYGAQEPDRYGGSTITEQNVLYVYDLLCAELTKDVPTEKVELSPDNHVSMAEVKKAFSLFVSDYPECFWTKTSYNCSLLGDDVVYIIPDYSFMGDALVEAKEALEASVAEIMSGMPSTNNYDKALYLHDELVKKVTYKEIGEHQTAYGALVAGEAVCAGYAAAYQLLLNRAGIMAWTIGGVSNVSGEAQIPHAWNVVWIEDDVCVYTDPTWADQDSGIFHYYFNLSKDEMAEEHLVDADTYVLPECNHTDQSYFDKNNLTVTDSTTMQQLAAMFGAPAGGVRKAAVYYSGNNMNAFLTNIENNEESLFLELRLSGLCRYEMYFFGNEIHITAYGGDIYRVNIEYPDTLTTRVDSLQYVVKGQPMQEVIFTARSGYYFPDIYSDSVINGVTVSRISSRQLRVSGTPTADVDIELISPGVMQKETTPQVTYLYKGIGSVELDLEVGMKYSLDGINWTEVTSDSTVSLTGITSTKIYVIMSGNGESTLDSDAQIIPIPQKQSSGEENKNLPESEEQQTAASTETEPTVAETSAESETAKGKLSNLTLSDITGCQMSAASAVAVYLTIFTACGVMLKKRK